MIKKILFIVSVVATSQMIIAQVYVDGFTNNGNPPNTAPRWTTSPGYTITHIDNTTTTNIIGNGTAAPYTAVMYNFYDNPQMAGINGNTGSGNNIASINMTGNTNIYVVARTYTGSATLRLSIRDINGYTSDAGTITDSYTISSTSQVYTYSYTAPQDAYSYGPPCTVGSPCTVDLTQITELRFSINPATGNYLGTVFIDYIQIGGTVPTLPNITIDSPVNGAIIPTSTTITASTTSSNIQSVTFFDGTTTLSVDVTPPYSHNWTNASLGSHTLTAVIHTNNGIANTSAQVIVTVAAPEINIKQGTTDIASGGTYNFGNVQNSTSSGPITFTIENTGGYALNLTGIPDKIILSGSDASQFTINQTSTLATVSAAGGTTTFTVAFNPTSPGTKSATITIPNDDANESSYTIHLTGTAVVGSIYGSLLNNNIDVYPNPVTERAIVTLKGLQDEVHYYHLLDPYGSVVLSGTIMASPDGTSERIDMSSLAAGTYYIQIQTQKGAGIKKIMKY